jgi:hypothetical protein
MVLHIEFMFSGISDKLNCGNKYVMLYKTVS